jgi:hydroxyacyl-ACP dehydratase HTD2-like protein with hotdog domain
MSANVHSSRDYATRVGRSLTIQDDITPFSVNELASTLGWPLLEAEAGMPVPQSWHWLSVPPIMRPDEVRRDGQVRGAEMMPPIALPRHMRADSKFFRTSGNPLTMGARATRISCIGSTTPKRGKLSPTRFCCSESQL